MWGAATVKRGLSSQWRFLPLYTWAGANATRPTFHMPGTYPCAGHTRHGYAKEQHLDCGRDSPITQYAWACFIKQVSIN
jgi:hypothetical protein